jgi:hypothetical protein
MALTIYVYHIYQKEAKICKNSPKYVSHAVGADYLYKIDFSKE